MSSDAVRAPTSFWIHRGAVHRLRGRHPSLVACGPAPDGLVVRRTGPRHVVDLAGRAEVLGRIAMAVQAPLHLQGVLLIHDRHQVDAAVAGRTANPLIHVDRVIEIHEVGKIVHAGPGDRFARCPAVHAPAPATAHWSRSGSGSSCRSWSEECRRSSISPRWYDSTGIECQDPSRGAYD